MGLFLTGFFLSHHCLLCIAFKKKGALSSFKKRTEPRKCRFRRARTLGALGTLRRHTRWSTSARRIEGYVVSSLPPVHEFANCTGLCYHSHMASMPMLRREHVVVETTRACSRAEAEVGIGPKSFETTLIGRGRLEGSYFSTPHSLNQKNRAGSRAQLARHCMEVHP